MTPSFHLQASPARWLAPLAATLLCATSLLPLQAQAADPARNAEIQSLYLSERAACMNGQSNQTRATCLQEAVAARQAARAGKLDRGNDAQFLGNAMNRCRSLNSPEQDECVSRMRGEGTQSGSVLDGGILLELVTTVPAK